MRKEKGDVYRVIIPFTGEKFFLDRNDYVIIDGSRLLHKGRQIPYAMRPMDPLYGYLELVRKATRSLEPRPWEGVERRRIALHSRRRKGNNHGLDAMDSNQPRRGGNRPGRGSKRAVRTYRQALSSRGG